METRAYRLQMRSPLHVGEQGIGNEQTLAYIPSDTLYSALVVNWGALDELRATLSALVDPNAAPALLLTSAFPCAGDVRLLPRPALPLLPQPGDKESVKTVKRVRWVSAPVFAALTAGIGQAELDALWQGGQRLQGGAVWVSQAEADALWSLLPRDESGEALIWWSDVVPRVTVDRIANASQIYHSGRAFFAEGCGLWFAARGEIAWLERMEQVLAMIADTGIGGLRSVGNGQFALHVEAPPSFLASRSDAAGNRANYAVLLSRMAPEESQMSLLRAENASYDLVLVGGFSGTPGMNPVVRRQVRMVAEGSVIGSPQQDEQPPGRLVDVTPDSMPWLNHRIYRNGFAFLAPAQLSGEGVPS